jgi:hypothetical protein
MFRNKIYNIGVPIITFVLGIFAQVLFDQWITSKNVIALAIGIMMICVVAIFIILGLTDKRFDTLENKLLDIAARTGLRVEFIEDRPDGTSYKRGAELIENAQFSITIVSPWEPFAEYEDHSPPSTVLQNARLAYYEAIKRQVSRHQHSDLLFHRRILQIPKEYDDMPLGKFKSDPTYYDYIKFVAEIQETHPHSCQLRRASRFVDIHYTIIDEQYVIMPFFTRIGNERLKRYGTFIFNDKHGDLVRCLNHITRILEARSHPIFPHQLVTPNGK